MATNESIEIPEGLEISSKTKDQYKNNVFMVKLKVRTLKRYFGVRYLL